ncbi:MAG: serine/threonine-protein phosphatase [Firmicutes bacterium]|jgi:hypothetical protein|nr:serine/threonine-protein phosphatase [Bacillota bacterium]MDH7496218.1 SpoIIE family protein phosphatase [Bacillota bacterium]
MVDLSANLRVEVGVSQLNKHGEELCGDSVEVNKGSGFTIVALSDGLGSGVKANILSSLTVRMIVNMLKGGLALEDVIDALARTLPVCEKRHLAYSTFSVLQIFHDGSAHIAEYDSPPAFVGRGRELRCVPRSECVIGGRVIKEAFFSVEDGDWIVMVSDGVLHAGIGGVWNTGWGWDRVAEYVRSASGWAETSHEFAEEIARVTNKLYGFKPGDDATIVAIRTRRARSLTVLVGPPVDRADDQVVVGKLMEEPGKKVVCGGTTGNMVARVLGKPIEVDLRSQDRRVPPTADIEGIDLVTEGMLTLSYTLEMLRTGAKLRDVAWKRDGASRLAAALLEADSVRVIVGRAINPAHQSPDVPVTLALKQKIVDELSQVLKRMGKQVSVEYY